LNIWILEYRSFVRFVIFIMYASSSHSDCDQFEEPMDHEDETQCQEADDMIDANDTISDNSQREQRYGHHQNKKKLKAEAMRKAELD